MRTLGILLLAAATFAATGSPTAVATPGPCDDPCTINAASGLLAAPGYDPAVAILANGTEVTWHSSDAQTHPHVETSASSNCIGVSSSSSSDSPAVRFEIWDGGLRTTVGTDTEVCEGAVGNAALGFTLAYRCGLHANMNGVLVVVADT